MTIKNIGHGFFFLALLLFIFIALLLSMGSKPSILNFELKVQDLNREYFVFNPKPKDNEHLPVVIVLHGGGGPLGTAELMIEHSGWFKKAREEGFIAVFAQGTLADPSKPLNLGNNPKTRNIRDWNEGSGRTTSSKKGVDDVLYIKTVIDDLKKRFSIDPKRIFVTGFSNGATMTLRLGVEISDKIAAIAPVAGALFVEKDTLENLVSLLNIVGTADSPTGIIVPIKDHITLWKKLLDCPKDAKTVSEGNLKITTFGNCKSGSEVLDLRIEGLGHVYPGLSSLFNTDPKIVDTIHATDVAWEFFKKHPQGNSNTLGLTLKEKCKQASDQIDQNCLEDSLRITVREGKVVEAFDVVAAVYSEGSQACHAFTHTIGEETYELFSKKKDFQLSPKTAYCAYGFYHGFMERLVQKTKNLKQANIFCDLVDQKLAAYASDAKLQCYHGIGHGTATAHDPRILGSEEAILTPALELCEKASTNDPQLYRCASGAFNALALYYISGEYNLPLDRNDPLRLCHKQQDRYKYSCYGNMNILLTYLTKNDLAKAASYIEKIEEDNFAIWAIPYLSAAVASERSKDAKDLVMVCRFLQIRLQLPCVEGIVHGLIEHGNPDLEYVAALQFCRSYDLTPKEKLACFNHAFGYLTTIYSKDKVLQICQEIEEPYTKSCLARAAQKLERTGPPLPPL